MSVSRHKADSSSALRVHGFSLLVFLAASAAPTPLYRLYQQHWHFATPWLTAIFAVYALALLLALLFGARLSDHLGRRPTIALAIALDLLAMVLFLCADATVWLVWARVVQGLATGLATAAIGAALLDLDRHRGAAINSVGPMLGMATGALGSTAVLQWLPAPLRSIYAVLAVALLLALVLTWRTPETAACRPGALASLRPRLQVPAPIRRAFLAVSPVNIAVWMLGGFYLSLMPSLAVQTLHAATPWLGGGVVAVLTLTAALAIRGALSLSPLKVLVAGATLLLAGDLGLRWAADASRGGGLLAASLLAGAGFGTAFLGAVRSVLSRAEAHERSQLMGVFYIESYLASSLPAMALGWVVQRHGLLPALHLYTDVIAGLLLLALAGIIGGRAHLQLPAAI